MKPARAAGAGTAVLSNGAAAFQRRYLAALRAHVKPATEPGPGPAERIGLRACELGLETLALARVHDVALATLAPPPNGRRGRRSLAVRAASFFAEALGPIEANHRPMVEALAEVLRLGKSVDRGTVDLATARRRITRESGRRQVVQDALATSDGKHRVLLRRSRAMEEELRVLSRSLLTSHEEERRRISRELHDALGQTLTAVNIGLASLKVTAAVDSKEFRGSVSRTQRLVQKSMRTVHQFARTLRPTLLDDLGLVPALLSYAKDFGRKNGIRVTVSAPEESALLDSIRRTALFRVAQEALVNVGRHARAENARVTLRGIAGGVRLEVWNDGTPFDVARTQRARTHRRLGLLCMRERMEMVGGTFSIRSSKEAGTVVRADVPLTRRAHA
jgi:signal transduction histidine kinase